jgi:proteasome lid subunit RPN8/RPN11
MANKPQASRLGDKYQTYPTAKEAAVAALRGISGNKQVESGGGVLYNKEQNVYAATDPVGQSDGSHFAAAVGVPKGWSLHSTYHTHPSGDRSTQFSDDDINMSQQLKAPSYVLAQDDNKIRVFDPASSTISKNSSGGRFASGNKYATGSPIDETPPMQAVASAPTPPADPQPTTTVPVTGSRITMKDFAAKHRARTTKYRHKIVNVCK